MNIIISSLAGAGLGLLLGLLAAPDRNRKLLAAIGAVGALIAAIILSGLMINPPLASPAVSAAAVARSLDGAALLLAVVFLLSPVRRSAHR